MNPKKSIRKKHRYRPRKTRGGAAMASLGQSSHLNTAITMFQYSFLSIILGPIYLIAELLNIPMNNINNLSRKAFDKNKESFLHIPFIKMIKGCPVKKINPEEFLLKNDMHIQQNVAIVSCDKEGQHKDKVKDNAPYVGDSFLNLFGMIPNKRKLRHHLFGLFQYIDNLRETDEERKTKVQKLFQRVSYKTLIQCYLIHKTIEHLCPKVNNEKTILLDEDVVNMVNPLYYSWLTPYDDKVYCMKKHITQKNFSDDDKKRCGAPCNTCTFRNSLGRMGKMYGSSSSCNQASTLESIFNTYYKYIEVKKKDPLPTTEEEVIPYLKTLTPKASTLDDKVDANDKDAVIKLFNRLMCKYDIIPTLQDQIKMKIKKELAKGYTMDHLLKFL